MEIKDVKAQLNRHVRLPGKDTDYILSGCIYRKGKEGYYYQAELLDVNCGNSITIAKLEDVEEINT